MSEETRSNQGYAIIESRTIGGTEIVIGHNPKAPNPYVCWYCKNQTDYYWGYYTNEYGAAKDKLRERCEDKVRYLRETRQIPPKRNRDRER